MMSPVAPTPDPGTPVLPRTTFVSEARIVDVPDLMLTVRAVGFINEAYAIELVLPLSLAVQTFAPQNAATSRSSSG